MLFTIRTTTASIELFVLSHSDFPSLRSDYTGHFTNKYSKYFNLTIQIRFLAVQWSHISTMASLITGNSIDCSTDWSGWRNKNIKAGHPWWRHQMETLSASVDLCEGNPPVTGGFPSQRPVTLWRLNKRLSKHSRRHRSHCNDWPFVRRMVASSVTNAL